MFAIVATLRLTNCNQVYNYTIRYISPIFLSPPAVPWAICLNIAFNWASSATSSVGFFMHICRLLVLGICNAKASNLSTRLLSRTGGIGTPSGSLRAGIRCPLNTSEANPCPDSTGWNMAPAPRKQRWKSSNNGCPSSRTLLGPCPRLHHHLDYVSSHPYAGPR